MLFVEWEAARSSLMGGEETISCTIDAYCWPGKGLVHPFMSTILCGRSGLLPDFRTIAHMWVPLYFSCYFPIFRFIASPPPQWRKIHKNIFVHTITTVMVDKEMEMLYTLHTTPEKLKEFFNVKHAPLLQTPTAKLMSSMQYLFQDDQRPQNTYDSA